MADKADNQGDPEIDIVIEDDKATETPPSEDAVAPQKDNAEEDGDEGDKPAKKRKKSNRNNSESARITKLLWDKQQEKDRADMATRELEAIRASNVQMEGLTAKSIEDSLSTKRDLLTTQLRDAHAEGDATKIAATTSELSTVAAQAAQLERYKLEKTAKPTAQQERQVQRQEPEADGMSFDDLYGTGNTEMRTWLDSNRDWFHPDSDNYNQEMVEDVTTKAQRLEQEWQRSGQGSEIGTRAYFREMNRYISENWSNEDEPVPQKTGNQQKGYAAPVNGRQSPNNSAPKRETVTIQAWERDAAINTPLRHDDGKPYTDDEKIKTYIQNKKIMASNPTGEITTRLLKKG